MPKAVIQKETEIAPNQVTNDVILVADVNGWFYWSQKTDIVGKTGYKMAAITNFTTSPNYSGESLAEIAEKLVNSDVKEVRTFSTLKEALTWCLERCRY